MWPHSLLFSSDEEASRSLSCAFRDLEFEVETCPEIFSAVEKITRRSFDVVVSDWNEGLEAVFLLKTVRELKANQTAFTIAIAGEDAAEAAREAELVAVSIAQDIPPGAADPKIYLAEDQRQVAGPVPALHVLGPSHRLKHQLARRVEGAGNDDLSIGRRRQRRGGARVGDHGSSPAC